MNDFNTLAGLFPEGIYLIPENKSTGKDEPGETVTPVTFKGKNQKNISVIYTGPTPITGEQETFLMKIMSAVSLTPEDIALMRWDEVSGSWHTLSPEKVLFFGTDGPFSGTLYEPFDKEGMQILCSVSLAALMQDKASKAQLWQGLKKMFNV
jgi:DNA polymerase III psi subunit